MLSLNKNQKRQPYGGHHFPEKGHTFTGDTFGDVVKKVSDFRTTNNIELGSPEQDVLMFYAKNWPWMVVSGDASNIPDKSEETTPYEEYRDWLFKTWRNPPQKFISTVEATDRWKKCENCEFNVDTPETDGPEGKELARRSFILSRGMKVPSFLGFCSLLRVDLPVFIYIEQAMQYSNKKKDGGTASACWL